MIQMFSTMRRTPTKKIKTQEIEGISKKGSHGLSERMSLPETGKTSRGIRLAIPGTTTMVENSATGATPAGTRTEGRKIGTCLIGGNTVAAATGPGGTGGQNHLPKSTGIRRREAMKKTEPRKKEVLRNKELQITLKGGGMSPRTTVGIRKDPIGETRDLLKVTNCAEETPEVQAQRTRERILLTRAGRGPTATGRTPRVRPLKNAREGQRPPRKRKAPLRGTNGVRQRAPRLRKFLGKSPKIPTGRGLDRDPQIGRG
jgi:hypothetical protein